MRKTKKAIASLAIAGMVLSMAPMSVFGATTDSNRLAGAGRVETAIAVANQGWANGADSVIVVPADDKNVVDALAAAPLAGQLNAPILVTYKGALDPQVAKKITELGAKNVYAVGALEDATIASLKAISGVTVEQIQGADRTETAAKVAAKLTKVNGSFVVAYEGSADALSAASYAAANGYSIVISNPDGTIPASETVTAPVYTVGGQAKYTGATPLAGADRYATNDAVNNGLTFQYDKVYVANGESLVDALAGAPLAAQTKSPIVLADASKAATGVNDNLTSTSKVIALGGVGAVSDSVLGQVAYQAPATLAVESVSAINAEQIEVKFNKAVDKTTAEDVTNYKLQNVKLIDGGAALTDAATLSDDGMTVTITLSKTGSLVNKKAYSFSVGTGVKDANGSALGAAYSTSFVANDTVAPVATVDATAGSAGTKTITVKFSEPVQNAGTYKVDGQAAGVTPLDAVDYSNNNEVTLTTSQNLVVGTSYTLTVASVTDFAGNVVATQQIPFTVAQAGAGNLVSATQASDNTIKLVYDTKIKSSTLPTYGTNLKVQGLGVDYNSSSLSIDPSDSTGKTVLLTVAGTSALYTQTQTSIAPTITVKGLQGTNGSVVTDVVAQTVSMVADQTKPAFVNATVADDNSYVLVQMSEKILQSFAIDSSKLTVVDADGVNATGTVFGTTASPAGFTAAAVAKSDGTVPGTNQAYVKLYNAAGKTFKNGTYTVTVPAKLMKDTASVLGANYNDAFTFTFTVSDLTNNTPIAVGATVTPAVNANGTESFDVDFGTVLNSTALSTANYTIDGKALPTGTSIVFKDSTKKVVTITLPAGAIDADASLDLAIFNVQNSAGTTMTGTVLRTASFLDNTAPTVASAKASAGKLQITFNETVTEQAAADAGITLVKADGTTVDTSAAVSVAGKVATVDTWAGTGIVGVDLSTVKVTIAAGAFKDVSASTIANDEIKDVAITDANVTIPVATAAQVGAAKNASDIQLTIANFDKAKAEGVTSYDVYLYATSGAVTKDTAPTFTVSTNVLVGDITVSGTNGLFTLPATITKDAKTGLNLSYADGTSMYATVVAKDALGNVAYASSETTYATPDYTAASVTTPLAAAGTFTATGSQTLVFSEALDATSQAAVKAAVDAAYTANGTATVSSAWNVAGDTLTVTLGGTMDATNTVVSTAITAMPVTDAVGNTSAALALQ